MDKYYWASEIPDWPRILWAWMAKISYHCCHCAFTVECLETLAMSMPLLIGPCNNLPVHLLSGVLSGCLLADWHLDRFHTLWNLPRQKPMCRCSLLLLRKFVECRTLKLLNSTNTVQIYLTKKGQVHPSFLNGKHLTDNSHKTSNKIGMVLFSFV